MHGDVNFSFKNLPSSTTLPLFQLGERVKVFERDEAALGTVRGFYWTDATDWECIHEDAEPGWWYVIVTDKNDPRYRVEPSMMRHESIISSYQPSVQVQHTKPHAVLHAEPVGTLRW